MRRFNAMRAGIPAATFALLLSGCGGGSGGGDEVPVVDLRDPAFGGPQGAAPAPAAAQPPAAAQGQAGAAVQGAPIGFITAEPGPGPIAGGSPVARGPAASGAANAAASPVAAASGPIGATDGGSGGLALNEMLSAANAANDPEAGRGRAEPQGGATNAPGMDPQQSQMRAMMGAMGGQGAGGPADPGVPSGNSYAAMMAGQANSMPGSPGAPGGFEGGFDAGGFDGFGGAGAGGSAEPADFESPKGAVDAFLDAIEAKDIQRLQEATALRAPREAETASRRKVFQAIREMSLSEEELNAIADDLDGFEVGRMATPTDAGIVSFILQKAGEYGSTLQRKIDVRKERAGWKVSDVTGVSEIKQVGGKAAELRNSNRDTGGGYDSSGP